MCYYSIAARVYLIFYFLTKFGHTRNYHELRNFFTARMWVKKKSAAEEERESVFYSNAFFHYITEFLDNVQLGIIKACISISMIGRKTVSFEKLHQRVVQFSVIQNKKKKITNLVI